jgi:hypothetical protein
MTVGNALISEACAEGRLRKALFSRQRKLPNINHRLHADLLKPADERVYFKPFVSESVEGCRLHRMATLEVQMKISLAVSLHCTIRANPPQ